MFYKEGLVPDRPQIFAACGKVIITVHGGRTSGPVDLSPITNARNALLAIMSELALAKENDTEIPIATVVRNSLADVHPETDYAYYEQMVLDLARMCIWFRQIEDDKADDKLREHLLEVKIFCDNMKQELATLQR